MSEGGESLRASHVDYEREKGCHLIPGGGGSGASLLGDKSGGVLGGSKAFRSGRETWMNWETAAKGTRNILQKN